MRYGLYNAFADNDLDVGQSALVASGSNYSMQTPVKWAARVPGIGVTVGVALPGGIRNKDSMESAREKAEKMEEWLSEVPVDTFYVAHEWNLWEWLRERIEVTSVGTPLVHYGKTVNLLESGFTPELPTHIASIAVNDPQARDWDQLTRVPEEYLAKVQQARAFLQTMGSRSKNHRYQLHVLVNVPKVAEPKHVRRVLVKLSYAEPHGLVVRVPDGPRDVPAPENVIVGMADAAKVIGV